MSSLGKIAAIGGVVAGLGLAYHLLESVVITSGGVNAPTPAGPGAGNVYGSATCPGPFAQLSDLVAKNPQIVPLMQNWQNVDAANSDIPGANRYSWAAFRTYVQRLGYKDPGPNPPQSFCPAV